MTEPSTMTAARRSALRTRNRREGSGIQDGPEKAARRTVVTQALPAPSRRHLSARSELAVIAHEFPGLEIGPRIPRWFRSCMRVTYRLSRSARHARNMTRAVIADGVEVADGADCYPLRSTVEIQPIGRGHIPLERVVRQAMGPQSGSKKHSIFLAEHAISRGRVYDQYDAA